MGGKNLPTTAQLYVLFNLRFLTTRYSVSNSLQFFQRFMLQCSGQSYGSSVSKIIVTEATVECNQTQTHSSTLTTFLLL